MYSGLHNKQTGGNVKLSIQQVANKTECLEAIRDIKQIVDFGIANINPTKKEAINLLDFIKDCIETDILEGK